MGRRGAAQRRLGFWCGAADAMAGPSMSAADEGRFRLYRRDGTLALLDSMARQAVVRLAGPPSPVIGGLRRGAPLADLLVAPMRGVATGLDLAWQRGGWGTG